MRVLAAISLSLMLMVVPASAGPFEDGLAAADRGDYATALRLWRPLAEQGYATTQYNLGIMYRHGRGVPQDYVEAVKWYRRAAEQGNARAQANLGGMYYNGHGVAQDDVEAAKWYRRAAEQGDADAQTKLGLKYYFGDGVAQDYVLAHMWSNLGAAQGVEIAVKIRDLVADRMTPDQMAEAQRMAREWVEEHGN